MSEDANEFDAKLWMAELNLSEPGIKKVLKNEITDLQCVIQLTLADINQLKLTIGDRRRLIGGIDILKHKVSTVTESPLEPPSTPDGSATDVVSVTTQSPNSGGNTIGPTSDVQNAVDVIPKTSFTLEEVSSFLAGSAIPANLQASVVQASQTSQLNQASAQIVSPNLAVQNNLDLGRPPFLPPHFPPLSAQVRQHQQPQLWGNSINLPYQNCIRPLPLQQQQYTSSYGAQSTVPVYSPQRPAFVPGRLSQTPRDQGLQQYSDGFQSASLHDLLAINENNFALNRPGDNLYLPCNFVSHIRGSSRSEEEELLTTVSGSKLYLSSPNRKIQPEKLSYGLFFGANAQILARLIPNLTPELAAYLDYLRKLGDLMVNYTTSSVFLLDHVHRYEVVEEGKTWNYIDPSLSLNVLKKRDVNVNSQQQSVNSGYRSNTVSRIGGGANNQQRQHQRSTTVICWLFNQHEGCSYGSGCRFLHICYIVACGLDHPAHKHIFRAQGNQQPSTNQAQSVAKQQSK
jgi:hypothetical protein